MTNSNRKVSGVVSKACIIGISIFLISVARSETSCHDFVELIRKAPPNQREPLLKELAAAKSSIADKQNTCQELRVDLSVSISNRDLERAFLDGRILSKLGDDESVPLFIRYIDQNRRGLATGMSTLSFFREHPFVQCLSEMGPSYIPLIVISFAHDLNSTRKGIGMYAVGSMGQPAIEPLLQIYLKYPCESPESDFAEDCLKKMFRSDFVLPEMDKMINQSDNISATKLKVLRSSIFASR